MRKRTFGVWWSTNALDRDGLIRHAEQAERLGYDSLWFGESASYEALALAGLGGTVESLGVVAIDPAVTATRDSDETGIIVAGVDNDGHGWVLEDASLKASPDTWAKQAIGRFYTHEADRIVVEVNNGGDLCEHTLRTVDRNVPITQLRASRGKVARAEPIAALYEQGKVHHVGTFGVLEDQMCSTLDGANSPDRVDALVWALTELMQPSGRFERSDVW